MKEVLTKAFWEGVKKTFEEARDSPPPKPADTAISEAEGGKDTPAVERHAAEPSETSPVPTAPVE